MSLEIIIGAGVAPDASNAGAFISGTQSVLFNGLNAVWKAADARLITLETPLLNQSQADECANHPAVADVVNGIAALSPTGVSLCNNHIMDCGAQGVLSTRSTLKSKQIACFGAGEDLDEADQPFFFVRHGVRVGVYAVCDQQSVSATDRLAGANPLDLVNLSDRIREIKTNCDRLIVLYYGENPSYPYPSPMAQKVCRKMAECGASLVICQNSGVVACSERWDNTTIVYGQGGFISGSGADCAEEGVLVRYTIGDFGADTVGYVPVVRSGGGAALADEAKSAEIMEGFQKRSLRVRVEGFVASRYDVFLTQGA